MNFVRYVRERKRLTRYALAKELGVPTQSLDHLELKGRSIRPDVLCRLKRVSGLSWAAFGKLLEREYGHSKR